jgi:hypothetical protein
VKYDLPPAVEHIVTARKQLRDAYAYRILNNQKNLEFTFDGKFVGDLGEAIAADHFDLDLDPGKHIDGYTRCAERKPVQVKATGRKKGGTFQFRESDYLNHDKVHLIAIVIHWDECKYEVVYNGPESKVRPSWNDDEHRAKDVTVSKMKTAQTTVGNSEMLPAVKLPNQQRDQ